MPLLLEQVLGVMELQVDLALVAVVEVLVVPVQRAAEEKVETDL